MSLALAPGLQRTGVLRPAAGGASATPTLDTAASYWICKNNATYHESGNDRLLDQISTNHSQLGSSSSPTDPHQPTFTNDGTYECLDFDPTGNAEECRFTSAPHPGTGDFTLVAVCTLDATDVNRFVYASRGGSPTNGFQIKTRSGNLLRITVSIGGTTIDEDHATTLSTGTRYLLGIRRSGNTWSAIIDSSVSTGKTLSGTVSSGVLERVGSDGSNGLDGKVFGVARFDNATVSLADIKSEILALAAL